MIQSKPYTIPRPVHARLTALYYLRTFWFILIGPFLFGLGLLFLGPNQVARFFGMCLAIWPMTVFARAYVLHRKVHKAWTKPNVMTIVDDAFLFESEAEKGGKRRLKFNVVRRVIPMFGFQLLQTRQFGFVAVPDHALPKGTDLALFLSKSI